MLRWVALFAVLASARVQAHRLDEYLQAALISLESDSVEIELNLTPGVAVFGRVLPLIDLDGDGVISLAEQQTYANRVLGDLSLVVDKRSQMLELIKAQFPPIEDMQAGLGAIRLILRARFEHLGAGPHEVRFVNSHELEIGAFLANALVPPKSILIVRQSRDDRQTEIRIDYSVVAGEKEVAANEHIAFAVFLCAGAFAVLLLKLAKPLRTTGWE